MQESRYSPVSQKFLYKESSVQIATFLGGPIIGAYLIAENFKNLGEHNKIKKTWIAAIMATVLTVVFVYLTHGLLYLPIFFFRIVYTVCTAYFLIHYQSHQINSHIKKGGRVYPVWRGLCLGILVLLIARVFFNFTDLIL